MAGAVGAPGAYFATLASHRQTRFECSKKLHAIIVVSKMLHACKSDATRPFMDKLFVHPRGIKYEVAVGFPLELVLGRKLQGKQP